jgi:hypothetical protein
MLDNNYSEREGLVIDLYKNQNKSIREIAKATKMSFRDIGFILKKEGLSHGIVVTKDNGNDNNNNETNNNKFQSQKATQAYELYDKGKKPGQKQSKLATSPFAKAINYALGVIIIVGILWAIII